MCVDVCPTGKDGLKTEKKSVEKLFFFLKFCVSVRSAPVARLVTLGSVCLVCLFCSSCFFFHLIQLSNCTVLIVVTPFSLFVMSIDIDLFPLFLFRFLLFYISHMFCQFIHLFYFLNCLCFHLSLLFLRSSRFVFASSGSLCLCYCSFTFTTIIWVCFALRVTILYCFHWRFAQQQCSIVCFVLVRSQHHLCVVFVLVSTFFWEEFQRVSRKGMRGGIQT